MTLTNDQWQWRWKYRKITAMRLAERMSLLGTETAFEVLARAQALEAKGRKIIHLQIGEPDVSTPENVVEAAVAALRDGWHHYTAASGIKPLREAIAEKVSSTRKIQVEPEEVVVTPGAKPIMFFTLLALVQKGDEVIYPNPGFPIYESMISYSGARPVPVPLREEREFRMDLEELAGLIGPKTRMLILNSPNNPTGSVLRSEDLVEVANLLADRDIMILSDEVYSHIIYEGLHSSIASLPGMKERTIILDGFSKTYAMTGWRLGYGVMNPTLAEQITKLMINSNSCTAAFTQMAGIRALRDDQASVAKMVETFRQRRDRVVELLNQVEGISCRAPLGAFYVFPNVTNVTDNSSELANFLLEEVGVAVLGGTAFGHYGEGYLRLSYATSMEMLEEGIEKIAQGVGAYT